MHGNFFLSFEQANCKIFAYRYDWVIGHKNLMVVSWKSTSRDEILTLKWQAKHLGLGFERVVDKKSFGGMFQSTKPTSIVTC